MAWTATLVSVARANGDVRATIKYDNGTTPFQETYTATDATQLSATVRNRVKALIAADLEAAQLTPGPLDTSDPTPPPPPTPTQAEIDQATFLHDLAVFRQMNTAISLGLMLNTNAAYVALKTKLQGEFIAAYLGLL